jgi:hypothetical protein
MKQRLFPFLGKSAASAAPCEGSLDYPAAREDLEAVGLIRPSLFIPTRKTDQEGKGAYAYLLPRDHGGDRALAGRCRHPQRRAAAPLRTKEHICSVA